MTSSADVSPTSTPCGTPLGGAPKYGTVIPNRIFVGGIAANTNEQELRQFFTSYGAVKDAKIIADRAGVSKGYGFITFENQEDADRIIKKEVSVEADNLVFRDRKLNIGPAIRKQQVLPRAFESPVSPGSVMYSNGIPYTYQNGMAIFASPDGGYAVQQAQPQQALMVPQTPPMYTVQPQYATYQVPPLSYASSYQTSPQWATTAAAAAASSGQWRYMTQSPTQGLTATGANPYMIAMQPELMYAQMQAGAYQPTELDATVLDGTGVEGSILPMEPQYATEVSTGVLQSGVGSTGLYSAAATAPATLQTNVNNLSTTVTVPQLTNLPTTSCTASAQMSHYASNGTATTKLPAYMSTINVAPYTKPLSAIQRRAYQTNGGYQTPTILVRNGHKVQCMMVPPKPLPGGQMTIMTRPSDTLSPPPIK